MSPSDPRSNWIWNFEEREFRKTSRKTPSRSKEENQRQTQPTYDAESGNGTWATLLRGECSHHCAIPAPIHSLASRHTSNYAS